jgi:hypothetical protein
MREMEFLPAWYSQLRRRKHLVMLQFWVTVVIAACFVVWLIVQHQTVVQKLAERTDKSHLLDQSRSDLRELNTQLQEKGRLEAEQRIVAKVGLHVEASRLLAKLDEIMPREMTLTDASFDTMEVAKATDPSNPRSVPDVDRKLLVKMSGVTPSDADWAGVLAKLSTVPFFQDVRLVGAHEKIDNGHVMRQFDVSFVVDLGNGE